MFTLCGSLDDAGLLLIFDVTLFVLLIHSGARIYWSTSSKLESVALNGSDRTLLLTKENAPITGLAFFGGNLFYIDIFSRYKLMDYDNSTFSLLPMYHNYQPLKQQITMYKSVIVKKMMMMTIMMNYLILLKQ